MVAELLHQLVAEEEVRSPQPAEAVAAARAAPLPLPVEVGAAARLPRPEEEEEALLPQPAVEALVVLHLLLEVVVVRLPPREAEVLLLLRPPQEAAVAEAVAALPPHRLPVHLLSASRERVRQTARLQARAAS